MIKYIAVFILGAGIIGIPYAHTLGSLEATNMKYSLALQTACSNKSDFKAVLDAAQAPEKFEKTAGKDHWNQAKTNILAECDSLQSKQ